MTSEFPLNSNFPQAGQLSKRSPLNTSALRVYLVLRSKTTSRQIKRIQNEGIIVQTKKAFIGYYFLTHKKRRGDGGWGREHGGWGLGRRADRLCIKLFSTLNIGVQQVLGGSF